MVSDTETPFFSSVFAEEVAFFFFSPLLLRATCWRPVHHAAAALPPPVTLCQQLAAFRLQRQRGEICDRAFSFFSLFSVCRHVDDFIDKSLVKVGGRLCGWTGAARQTVERGGGEDDVDVNPSSRLQERRSCSYYPANSQTQS